jgi:hypothetical protein
VLLGLGPAALAGPPYVSDDPEPTAYRHFEIYGYDQGLRTEAGTTAAAGIDFNYGAGPNLQLTLVLPVESDRARGAATATGLSNLQLAAKYRFLHDADGWDVAVFPRLFLPSASRRVGTDDAALFLPLWLERDFGQCSGFGGGGYVFDRRGDSRDYVQASAAIACQVLPALQLGAELFYQSPDAPGTPATVGGGGGVRYDLGEVFHLLGYLGRSVNRPGETGQYSWYAALLVTF